MALLVPYHRQQSQERNFSGRPTTTWGTVLTASATPHALPASPTEIIASTAYDACRVVVQIDGPWGSNTNTDALLNIYLGAASSEVLFIPNLLAGWVMPNTSTTPPARGYLFPLFIPRGSRISASLRALIASETANVRISLYGGDDAWAGAGVESVGAVTASSRGTNVTPGTTSDGTFTDLATTVRAFRYVFATIMGNPDTTLAADRLALDLGTGSALIAGLENFSTIDSSSEYQSHEWPEGRWVDVAAGTALQARLQSQGADAEAKSVIAWGVY